MELAYTFVIFASQVLFSIGNRRMAPQQPSLLAEKKRWESSNKEEPSEETESKCFIFIFDGFLQLNHQSLDHFSLFQFKNVIRKPSFNHLTLFYVFFSPSRRWKRSKEEETEREREREDGRGDG